MSQDQEDPLTKRARLSIFTLGKTYRWVSRARVSVWFRTAFGNVDSSNSGHQAKLKRICSSKIHELRKSAMAGQPRPKIFYILPRRHEELTLEKDLTAFYEDTSNDYNAQEDKSKSVPKWIRQSSCVFREDYLEQYHAKMLQEASKSCTVMARRSATRRLWSANI